ncbi:MAG: chemotaxis protein CheD [Spirochaetota bacterium]
MNSKYLEEYFINPGELIISKEPIIIRTVLGSCVSVCLYDSRKKIGSMCHYLLPVCPDKKMCSTKYGDIAIPLMIKKLQKKYGCKKEDLKGYLVGGAFVVFDERQIFFIGDRNVDIAKKILSQFNIPIVFTDILGEKGRKVIFNTQTGEIKVSIIEHITLENLYNK